MDTLWQFFLEVVNTTIVFVRLFFFLLMLFIGFDDEPLDKIEGKSRD